MDIDPATPLPEPRPLAMNSVPGASGLSTLQREWAREFILNRGNATKAAVLAGYAESSASISGRKNCLNPAVMAYVKQLSTADAQQFLPLAVQTFVDVASDPEQDGKARVLAAEKLVIMAGAMPRGGGPTINVGVQINGQQAQALIGEVWAARNGRMSSIGGTMPDTPATLESEAIELLPASAGEPAQALGAGGDQLQGPVPESVSIPTPLPEHPQHQQGPDPYWGEGAG